ncbi:plastocyanin/azurin family copper-binding protein [Methylophaga sp. OBS4]|uniref:plastocyanin/azurin family copper-binding protein n=1 Tax=Methylophaga sp. OBS4 TaxID=2991935 RepID=UPI0022528548|nr:plastocyanin/azurin family copper-binding protein [Methylophaga sp. OBS4]MCX4188404.1 plastocyanin/azurin family copper-binding protein [Methylophaga sp. OBS4]
MKYGKSLIAAALSAATLMSTAVMAENHVIRANVTNFDPMVVHIQPGDTVSWVNMNGHIVNTKFVEADGNHEYIPEGAEGWTSAMGEDFQTAALTTEGVYLYKCDPHWGAGMGGAIIVGQATNLEDIKSTNPKGALKRLVKKAEKAVK